MKDQKKVILITGSSSGIGLATCKLLANEGYYVFAGAKDTQGLKALNLLNQENIKGLMLDVTNKEHIDGAVLQIEMICNQDKKFHALINNAAYGLSGPVELCSSDQLKKAFDINLFGLIELTKSILPQIRKDKGRVINISSTNAIISLPFMGIYAATKFALEAITDSLRMELKKWNIPVCSIYPDIVKTPIFDKSIPLSYKHFESNTKEEKELYRSDFDLFTKAIYRIVEKGVEPEVIAECILKCVNAVRPKMMYIPEKTGKVTFLMKKLLSKKALDKFLLKQVAD